MLNGLSGVWNLFHQTLDRNIAGDANEIELPSVFVHISLSLA
jgi:hypothetical protein